MCLEEKRDTYTRKRKYVYITIYCKNKTGLPWKTIIMSSSSFGCRTGAQGRLYVYEVGDETDMHVRVQEKNAVS